jgi:protein ImuB
MAAGVRAGMSLAHARALLAGAPVQVEPFRPQRDGAALQALGKWANRFSPIVAVDLPDGLLIDITGCQRLFGGERRLLDGLADSIERLGFGVCVASARAFGCAWAVARFGRDDRSVIRDGAEREVLAPLPVAALRLERQTVDALHEVGIGRIGHLFDLRRSELAERFGLDLLRRLDQATGAAAEAIEPVRAIAPPRAQRVFDGPVKQLEAVMLTVRDLVAVLARELEQRESGARRIDLELSRIDGAPLRWTVRLSRPSRNPRHLWSLLGPKVEAANLGFGVEAVALVAARTGRLCHEQMDAWPAPGDDGRWESRFGELLDALADRLGADRITRVEPVESHIPERAFRHQPVREADRRAGGDGLVTPADRPSALFERPEPIEVIALTPDGPPSWLKWRGAEHSIVASAGPERIGGEWWNEVTKARSGGKARRHEGTEARSECETRDYFEVQDDCGRWLWVYRVSGSEGERSHRWFVHGVWA